MKKDSISMSAQRSFMECVVDREASRLKRFQREGREEAALKDS